MGLKANKHKFSSNRDYRVLTSNGILKASQHLMNLAPLTDALMSKHPAE